MTCLTDDMMQGFIDAELSVAETSAVQEHIVHCKHCSDKVAKLKQEREQLLELMALLVDDNINIPDFAPPVQHRKAMKSVVKFIIYSGVAAVALVFVLLVAIPKYEPNNSIVSNPSIQECVPVKIEEAVMMEFDFADGVDANKPIHQQQMTISVIDANGRIIGAI